MAQTITHAKTSSIPDGTDPNQVQPSDWNADHDITGTVDYSELSGKPATFPPTLPIAQSGVTNLVSDLAAKAPLANPAFTGNPTAPTPTAGDNDTSIATTAFVVNAIATAATVATESMRNRLINGDFAIDQRAGGGAYVPTSVGVKNYGSSDRWFGYLGQTPGTIAMQRIAHPNFTGEYAWQVNKSAVDDSLAAGDVYFVGQYIEGIHLRGASWGNANAKPVILSFDAKASAGTPVLAVFVQNGSGTRSWVGSVTLSTTMTRYSIAIPGDVTGTWNYDLTIGALVGFSLGIGSTYQGTAGAWAAANRMTVAGATNFMATGAPTLTITDVQFEIGDVATPFERRLHASELTLCQRYCHFVGGTADSTWPRVRQYMTANGYVLFAFPFPTKMRVLPTVAKVGAWTQSNTTGGVVTSGAGVNGVNFQMQAAANGEVDAYPTDATGLFSFTAEL